MALLFVAETAFGGVLWMLQTYLVTLVAFALTYLLVRFVLVGLARWATTGETHSLACRYGSSLAKVIAFANAVAFGAGFASVDVPFPLVVGLAVVFVLGCVVYRFERTLEKREIGA